MRRSLTARTRWAIPLSLAATLAAPTFASAQGGPGFLFDEPSASVKLETGYGFQFASGDIYDLSHDELTLSHKDLAAPYLGGEIAARLGQRWDAALGFGYSKSSHRSEYRHYVEPVGDLDLPIEQTTELRIVPLTVTARYYLSDRGRSVGRFAWVPEKVTPYVGAGVGIAWYRFEQFGDFVDLETLDIFFDDYDSEGTTGIFRALVGTGVSLGGPFELTGEARYQYLSAEMNEDFDGYGPLDLSGVQGVFGIAIRF